MKNHLGSLPSPLQQRLDRIGLKIVRGKEAIDRKEMAQARDILTEAFVELVKLMKGTDSGEFRNLSREDSADLMATIQAMAADLETLLKQIPKNVSDYFLADVEAMHREYPETFHIPSERERRNLLPGDMAKLIFESAGHGERMWVQVEKAVGRGRYEGKLKNTPTIIASLDFDSPITFSARNVADIRKQDPMN